MKKTNPMLKGLPAAKKIFACSIILSMVLSLNSAFFIGVAKAQDDLPPLPTEEEYMPPEGDYIPGDMPLEGDFVGDMPPLEGDMPMDDGVEPYYPEDMIRSSEVLEDMQVTIDDLGVVDPAIKRDSFFYPIKHLGRNIQETFTFDPINKAELQLQHANQELADVMQLVDDKGIENVDSGLIIDSVDWFENKLEDIKDAAENIKDEKSDQPAEIETFLDEFTDKHFYEHKILEEFDDKVTEKMGEVENAEDVFAALKDKQDEMLEDFGGILTTVDDPEKIPERLATIADGQEGSSFKLIKTAEILKKLEEQVPEQGKAAIENARERTMDLLEEDMKALPAIVRAEKFEEYTNTMPGDETVQLSIFEQLKQLPNIPQDMLEKIEEIKEFAVSRFEKKIEKFDKPETKDKFFEKLTGDSMSDIMVLEELKAKITAKQTELRAKIEEKHNAGVEEFKKKFTDVESQTQAARFEKLVKEMTSNPNPKTFRLLNELEMEVAQDPDKAAFINGIKNKTKAEFENKFREEGDRFFDRMASFDPNDMMVFQEFEQEEFFDPGMMGQFFDHQTDMYKDHIQNIDNPDMFNRFQERFQYAPPEVIGIMKQNNDFEDMMQFKMRQMMEQEIMLKEREMQMQMERDWRLNEDDFQLQIRQVRNDDEKTALYAQRRESDMALMEKEFDQRKMMMEARLANDPFCDAMCREYQLQFMEQDMENKKWNLQEDARMREFEMEMNMAPNMGFDPFAGKCTDPKTCMDFCYQNPDLPECRVHEPMSMDPGYMGPMGPGDPMMGPGYMGPMGPPPCPPGMINMPRGSGNWECVNDPYYKPPEFFKQCPPGNIWNEAKGFCEFDKQTFQPAMDMYFGPGSMPPPGGCPPGEWWDPGRNSCIRDDGPMGPGEPGMMPYDPYMPPMNFCGPNEYWDDMRGCMREDFKQCGPDEYFDFYEQRCIRQMWTSCPPGEYWDARRQSCIRDVIQTPTETCQPGYFWDFYKNACVEDRWAPPPPPMACPGGEYWDPGRNMCVPEGHYPRPITECPDLWDPLCGTDNITYSNECYAKQVNVGVQYWGECAPTQTPIPPGGYCGDGRCDPNEYCPQDCETGGWCGDGMCQSYEDQWSCPSDCPGGPMTCTNYATMGQGCNPSTGTCCSDGICSNMYGPGTCVSSGTPTGCGSYTSSGSCTSNSCIWCEGESAPYSCFGSDHVCGGGNYYCNYNGICDNAETSGTCPSDCGGTTPEGTCSSMGGTCCNVCAGGSYISGTECNCCGTCLGDSCPDNTWTTNAGACDYSYCPNGCTFDNSGCPNGCMTTGGWCGDGTCNVGETPASCPSDCGTTTTCPDNTWTTNAGACDYSFCPNGCTFDSQGCPSGCMTTGGTACDYDGMCDSDETMTSCPADCGTTPTGCGSYITSPSCTSAGCTWCEGESTPYSCFGTDHVCGGTTGWCGDGVCDSGETITSCPSDCGDGMTCNTWVSVGQSCDPSTGICCSDGMCSNMSGPGTCESSGGTMDCNYNGICDGNETMSSCPDDCGGTTGWCGDGVCDSGETMDSCPSDCGAATQTCYDFGGMCCGASDTCSGYYEYSATDCPSYCCVGSCQVAEVCGDGMCSGMEDSWSCPSDCGSASMCGDGMCDFDETMDSCPSDCGGGMGGWCGDGICDGGEYCPEDCGGEVMGVMSIREIDEIDEQENIFAKVWQGIKAVFVKDKPVTKPTVTAYIPHKTLAANPYLKERILWTEGNNYYKLISQYQPREPKVLGAKTEAKVKFPLVTIWEILTIPFK